mgnify:CR=1 FL=1
MELRAPDSLGLAKVHIDKDHLHIHCMISANQIESKKASRISKEKFRSIRRTLEEYQLQQYPELNHSYVHSRDREKYQDLRLSKSHNAVQMKKQRRTQDKKEQLRKTVNQIMEQVSYLQTLEQLLARQQMKIYRYRGRIQGVVHEGKKYRFSNLLGKDSPTMTRISEWNERIKPEKKLKSESQKQPKTKDKTTEKELDFGLELGLELSQKSPETDAPEDSD